MYPLNTANISPTVRTTSSYLYVFSVSQAASLTVIMEAPFHLLYGHYQELIIITLDIMIETIYLAAKSRAVIPINCNQLRDIGRDCR